MCGRYANHVRDMHEWADILGDWPGEARMSMNIAPTQSIPVVIQQPDGPRSRNMRWGLVPAWSDTEKPSYATFNARIEGLSGKPAFRGACSRRQTCLVPASGYYEWTGEKGHKRKHYIHFADHGPLVMAGLWDRWQSDQGSSLYSCTIVTRPAMARIASIHPRMPLILPREHAHAWLTQAPAEQLATLGALADYDLRVSEPPGG